MTKDNKSICIFSFVLFMTHPNKQASAQQWHLYGCLSASAEAGFVKGKDSTA